MTDVTVDKALLEQALADLEHISTAAGQVEFIDKTCQKLRAALAEPAVEPVAWEWRWFDAHPDTVTFGQWSEWKRVEPRNRLCTVEDSLNEFRAYIADGDRYELRALYTSPPPPANVPMLTDEETYAIFCKASKDHFKESFHFWEHGIGHAVCRAIEAAVRQKAGL